MVATYKANKIEPSLFQVQFLKKMFLKKCAINLEMIYIIFFQQICTTLQYRIVIDTQQLDFVAL